MRGSQYSVSAYATPFTRPLSAVRAGPQKEGPVKTQKAKPVRRRQANSKPNSRTSRPLNQRWCGQVVKTELMTTVRTILNVAPLASRQSSSDQQLRGAGRAPGFRMTMRASRSQYPQTIDARTRAPLAVKDQTFGCVSEPAPLRAKEQQQCQTAKCSSTPHIPRKPGWWCNATAG